MSDRIDDLERKAKAATPGPWSADGYGSGQQVTGATGTIFADTHASREDAEFIAEVNPAAILRLVEQLRKADAYRALYVRTVEEWNSVAAEFRELKTERDVLAARLAAVEALLTESEAQDWTFISEVPLVEGDRLRAALSAAPTDTTKETP